MVNIGGNIVFFKKEILSFNILDVLQLNQKDVCNFNKGRNFNALSFRIKANTTLITKQNKYYLKDNYVSYVPARLDYQRISSSDQLIVVHFDTTDYVTNTIECFLSNNPNALLKLFNEILQCWNKKEVGYKYKCSAILYEIFAECYSQNYVLKQSQSKIQKSVEYLLSNYKNSQLTINEIAKKSFVSEVYFRKIFKKEYGISPQKYIVNLRMQTATGLISTGYYSLKEVAFMCGYTDYKYFSVEFKRIKGVSPSMYSYNYKK